MTRLNMEFTSADGIKTTRKPTETTTARRKAVFIKEPRFADLIGRELTLIMWDVVSYEIPTKEIRADGTSEDTTTTFEFLQCKFLAEGRRVFNFCLNTSLITTLAKNGIVEVKKDENGVIYTPDMDLGKLKDLCQKHPKIKGYFWQDENGRSKRFLTKEALDELESIKQEQFEAEMTPTSELAPEIQGKI